jgi:hypothetical protein
MTFSITGQENVTFRYKRLHYGGDRVGRFNYIVIMFNT